MPHPLIHDYLVSMLLFAAIMPALSFSLQPNQVTTTTTVTASTTTVTHWLTVTLVTPEFVDGPALVIIVLALCLVTVNRRLCHERTVDSDH